MDRYGIGVLGGRLTCALLLAAGLLGCDPPGPPPDVLKTQRQALDKAKGVEATIEKADEEARKQADDASK